MRLSHLRNWKVEDFFEIRRQTSKKGVKTPVVAEMCDNYPPHGWRSEDFKPWGVIFLKKINNVVRGVTYFKTWKNPCHSSSLPPTSQIPFNQNLLFKFRQLPVSNRPAIPTNFGKKRTTTRGVPGFSKDSSRKFFSCSPNIPRALSRRLTRRNCCLSLKYPID